jgi:hypothetical protein
MAVRAAGTPEIGEHGERVGARLPTRSVVGRHEDSRVAVADEPPKTTERRRDDGSPAAAASARTTGVPSVASGRVFRDDEQRGGGARP